MMMNVNKVTSADLHILKPFAITMSWAFPAVFSLLLPWLFSFNYQLWPISISAFLLSLWAIKPDWLIYPYKFWMTVGGAIGWVNTRIILGFCFYVLIMPLGQVMKRLGRLDYQGKMTKNKASNYQMNKVESDKNNLENPF